MERPAVLPMHTNYPKSETGEEMIFAHKWFPLV